MYTLTPEDVRSYLATKKPTDSIGRQGKNDECLLAQVLLEKYPQVRRISVTYHIITIYERTNFSDALPVEWCASPVEWKCILNTSFHFAVIQMFDAVPSKGDVTKEDFENFLRHDEIFSHSNLYKLLFSPQEEPQPRYVALRTPCYFMPFTFSAEDALKSQEAIEFAVRKLQADVECVMIEEEKLVSV